jgi:hypothetical protein
MKWLFLILYFSLFPTFILAATTVACNALNQIGNIIRNIAVGGAVLMIVVGGFQWMISAGDPAKISDAKDRIFAAILGLVIIALAEVIATLVGGRGC